MRMLQLCLLISYRHVHPAVVASLFVRIFLQHCRYLGQTTNLCTVGIHLAVLRDDIMLAMRALLTMLPPSVHHEPWRP